MHRCDGGSAGETNSSDRHVWNRQVHIILLSAPAEVIVERLATRTNNPYGKHPEEAARVVELIGSVEPLLRRIASDEIDTSVALDEVVTRVLRLTESES